MMPFLLLVDGERGATRTEEKQGSSARLGIGDWRSTQEKQGSTGDWRRKILGFVCVIGDFLRERKENRGEVGDN